jgi:hypothetical protein
MTQAIVAALEPLISRVRTDVSWIKRDGRQSRTDESLTPARLAKHLNGGPARGVVPMKPGQSSTMVALLDFDSHKGETTWRDMQAAALRVCAVLYAAGGAPVAFRSSGGKGIHLYLLWEQPQDAYSVRQWLAGALASVGFAVGVAGVAKGEIEVFPKQDKIEPDRFGNQFILPLAGLSVPLDLFDLDDLPREWIVGMAWPMSRSVPLVERLAPATRAAVETPELAVIRSALAAIPDGSDCLEKYEPWLDIVHAVHSATDGSPDGLSLAQEFSQRSSAYDADELDAKWAYAKPEGGITVGTLYKVARELGGWQEPIEDVFEVIEAASEEKKPLKFKPIQVAEFVGRKPPGWIVKDVIPRADVILIFGESGSGKSFVALDMLAAICRGIEWRGKRTRQGPVLYVAAEGASGFRNRVHAYCLHNGVDPKDLPLHVVDGAPNLLQTADALEIVRTARAVGPLAAIVVDTLAQTTPGANENAGEDMGKALAHCKNIRRATGAPVILIHHAGKDLARGARGWSGIKAAADAEIEISKTAAGRAIRLTKQKDGEDGLVWGFELEQIQIGIDEDGDVVTSCVVREAALPVVLQVGASLKKLGPTERTVVEVVNEIAMSQTSGIEVEAVIAEAAKRMPDPDAGKRDTRKQRAKRALLTFCEGDDAPYWLEDGCLSIV